MRLKPAGKYLAIPVGTGAKNVFVRYYDGAELVREYLCALSDDPEYYVYEDVSDLAGRELTVETEPRADFEFGGFFDELPPVYGEEKRPKLYFTPKQGWMNDPNGLHYFNGAWHMFFQHNPYGRDWGNMHWGHAVSDDLIHWTELGETLRPDALGTMFSGSAVVDGGKSVLIYTANGGEAGRISADKHASQCVAYSTDGINYTKYDKNPVLPHIVGGNRDPKVFYHEPSGKWVMPLYLESDEYGIFTSDDLLAWDEASRLRLAGCAECPDLFPLEIGGTEKWIFWSADGHYYVGAFDGKVFTPESELLRHLWRGGNADPYASQTFANVPDGRRIQLHWLQKKFAGTSFNSAMSLPHELTLEKYPDGTKRLRAKYSREIDLTRIPDGVERVRADLADGDVTLRGVRFHYNAESGAVEFAGRSERVSLTGIDAVADNGIVGALLDGGFAFASVGTDE